MFPLVERRGAKSFTLWGGGPQQVSEVILISFRCSTDEILTNLSIFRVVEMKQAEIRLKTED